MQETDSDTNPISHLHCIMSLRLFPNKKKMKCIHYRILVTGVICQKYILDTRGKLIFLIFWLPIHSDFAENNNSLLFKGTVLRELKLTVENELFSQL